MKNYIGEKYNMLTIIKEVSPHIYPSGMRRRKFICKCDCGNEKEITINHIKGNAQKSCGCWNIQKTMTHGLNNTRIQRIFNGMKNRCNNPSLKEYKNYGGRGIKCEWGNLLDFWEDMKQGYSDVLTIERIDNDGNYIKSNCRWATMKEQAQNRRHKTAIIWDGKTKSQTQWAKHFGLSYHALKQRLSRAGGFEEMILKYNMK